MASGRARVRMPLAELRQVILNCLGKVRSGKAG